MKYIFSAIALVACAFLCSCSSVRSGGDGITDTEIYTQVKDHTNTELQIDQQGITYTIDVSTQEGRLKLNGLSLSQAKNLALQEAAIKNNCARIVSPKFSQLIKGKHVLRITVFGFPARYKNVQTPKQENIIIIK